MSDEMAAGAMRTLTERGLAVPDDMSIVGVDDHEFGRVVGLTTIHQPVADHGAAAARLLLAAIEATGAPGSTAAAAPTGASGCRWPGRWRTPSSTRTNGASSTAT